MLDGRTVQEMGAIRHMHHSRPALVRHVGLVVWSGDTSSNYKCKKEDLLQWLPLQLSYEQCIQLPKNLILEHVKLCQNKKFYQSFRNTHLFPCPSLLSSTVTTSHCSFTQKKICLCRESANWLCWPSKAKCSKSFPDALLCFGNISK